ncbi:MAG: PQQ-like beta-propeller repeat protein [Planctomycetaceae bacterium]|nr:PQQ-like beta-propeller repeat protein [Planctomycetaceae bacterium]
MIRRSLVLSMCGMFCLVNTVSVSADEGDWPAFRGADARGVSTRDDLPIKWSATENVKWKQAIPGRGWSCPVTWGDRVYLTTVVSHGKEEAAKKGLYFGGDRSKPSEDDHDWKVIALDLNSGDVVWEKMVDQGPPRHSLHIKNSYATETPITDGERVYAMFGNRGFYCLDKEGNTVWSKPLEPFKTRYGWGTASSPMLYEGRLYLVMDNEEHSSLTCLDALTGEEIWSVPRDEKSNWSTPYMWKNAARTEIVTAGSKRMRGYDLDGKELWELGGGSANTCGTPYAVGDLLYVTSGYILDKKKPVFAVRPGASGDITPAGETVKDDKSIAWVSRQLAPYVPSTIVYKDQIYILYDQGLFASSSAKTGKRIYGKQRLQNGTMFTASPWAYRDRIFCLNEDGKTAVITAGEKFAVEQINELADDDMCMATPALAGNKLLIRTTARLYCIEEGAGK